MTAPEDAVIETFYRARCKRCGWQGGERKTYTEAHLDKRIHLTGHVITEIGRKGGGKR